MTTHRRRGQSITPFIVSIAIALGLVACAPETEAKPLPSPTSAAESRAETGSERPAPEPTAEVSAPGGASSENPGFSPDALDDLLRQAAWANDVETGERLIKWGANVNAKDDTQQSAYLVATSEGHLEFLRLTLRSGADVHALDSWNGTGLIRAAERGHWGVLGDLVRTDVPLDHVNRVGYQAIHEAVWMGRDDASYHAAARILYAAGASFDTPSVSEGLVPLQMAEYRGFGNQAENIRTLLAEPVPADPTAALLDAASSGNPYRVAAALRAGADGSARDAAGRSAYQLALAGEHVQTVQILTAMGLGEA